MVLVEGHGQVVVKDLAVRLEDARDAGGVDIGGAVPLQQPLALAATRQLVVHVPGDDGRHLLAAISGIVDGCLQIRIAEIARFSAKVAAPNAVFLVAQAGWSIVGQEYERVVGRFIDPQRPSAWKVKRDGGEFDQLTGATVTPRAVVSALRAALEFAFRNHVALFEQA